MSERLRSLSDYLPDPVRPVISDMPEVASEQYVADGE
jgi:hypothetical protein